MIRTRTVLSLFLLTLTFSLSAAAADSTFVQKPLASGFVNAVNPFTKMIALHGGILHVDASNAEFRGPSPNDVSSFEAIRPGIQIAVVFEPGTYRDAGPIKATIVQILQEPNGTITGKVEKVDPANSTFTVLGQTIHVDASTQYGGSMAALDPHKLEDLQVGQDVTVFLTANTYQLEAFRVYAIAPPSDSFISFSGVLKQIKGSTWTLIRSNVSEFQVTSSTSVDGQPHIGDLVRVAARVDDGVVSAQWIEVLQPPCPGYNPNPRFDVKGYVTARSADAIDIQTGQGAYHIELTDETLWDGEPAVGENAIVQVDKIGTRFVAVMVTRADYRIDFFIDDKVIAIGDNAWTIGAFNVKLTGDTTIHGDPKAGDEVLVIAHRLPNGDIVAQDITKKPGV